MSTYTTLEAQKKNATVHFSALTSTQRPEFTAVRNEQAAHQDERVSTNFGHTFSQIPRVSDTRTGGTCPVASPRACPFGGACHTCPVRLQAKLAVSQPVDEYEREADLVAEGIVHRWAVNRSQPVSVLPIVHEVLRAAGQPLDAATRDLMQVRLGHDFHQVHVHTDARAAESARCMNARAYTVGREIVFGNGEYQPQTEAGRRLLAHELTHVTQVSTADAVPTLMRAAANSATPTVNDVIENARREAHMRCQIAYRNLSLISESESRDLFGRDMRRVKAAKLVREIFGKDLDMGQVTEIVGKMRDSLRPGFRVVQAPKNDPTCVARHAYVEDNSPPIHLCEAFFRSNDQEQQIRDMVHEAAHLAGIGEYKSESYCPVYDRLYCGGFDVADSWAQLVHFLSGEPADKPESIVSKSK
jgi:hypothetical protein